MHINSDQWSVGIKMNQRGITLLELIITIAIVGVVFVAATTAGFGSWTKKKGAQNVYKELMDSLLIAKSNSLSKNTTAKVSLSESGGVYTVTVTTSSTATTSCTSTGTWNNVSTKNIDMPSSYGISGSGMTGDLCFYRDGSSSGASYAIASSASGNYKTYTIDVTIATGFIDVTES